MNETNMNKKALVLSETLDDATSKLLANKKGPSRIVNELDNRGSHFYLALYWAQELASQTQNLDLQKQFYSIAKSLSANETQIINELNAAQGGAVNLEGYYMPKTSIIEKEMRPSTTSNSIIDGV